jgi:hypothetical protein
MLQTTVHIHNPGKIYEEEEDTHSSFCQVTLGGFEGFVDGTIGASRTDRLSSDLQQPRPVVDSKRFSYTTYNQIWFCTADSMLAKEQQSKEGSAIKEPSCSPQSSSESGNTARVREPS